MIEIETAEQLAKKVDKKWAPLIASGRGLTNLELMQLGIDIHTVRNRFSYPKKLRPTC